MRTILLLWMTTLLAGCISFSSTESASAPDYATLCQGKEMQCRDSCGAAGIQAFSCKAAPDQGFNYQCQCKQAGAQI
jgi:uncharacterized protein YceK